MSTARQVGHTGPLGGRIPVIKLKYPEVIFTALDTGVRLQVADQKKLIRLDSCLGAHPGDFLVRLPVGQVPLPSASATARLPSILGLGQLVEVLQSLLNAACAAFLHHIIVASRTTLGAPGEDSNPRPPT